MQRSCIDILQVFNYECVCIYVWTCMIWYIFIHSCIHFLSSLFRRDIFSASWWFGCLSGWPFLAEDPLVRLLTSPSTAVHHEQPGLCWVFDEPIPLPAPQQQHQHHLQQDLLHQWSERSHQNQQQHQHHASATTATAVTACAFEIHHGYNS